MQIVVNESRDLVALHRLVQQIGPFVHHLCFRCLAQDMPNASPLVFPNIKTLAISGIGKWTSSVFRAWLDIPPSHKLRSFDISGMKGLKTSFMDEFLLNASSETSQSTLQHVNLAWTLFDSNQLSRLVARHPNIAHLDLTRNQLILGSEYVKLNQLSQLCSLVLEDTLVDDDVVQDMEETWTSLERLSLTRLTGLSNDGISFLLSKLQCIKWLALDDTNIHLTSLLRIPFRHLNHLSLQGCIAVNNQVMDTIAQEATELTRLNVSFCTQITDVGAVQCLVRLSKLSILELDGCYKLTHFFLQSVKALFTMAPSNQAKPCLKYLSILDITYSPKIIHQLKTFADEQGFGVHHKWTVMSRTDQELSVGEEPSVCVIS